MREPARLPPWHDLSTPGGDSRLRRDVALVGLGSEPLDARSGRSFDRSPWMWVADWKVGKKTAFGEVISITVDGRTTYGCFGEMRFVE